MCDLLKTIREGEKTTRQRGLGWTVMCKRLSTVEGGSGVDKGDIDSVAPETANTAAACRVWMAERRMTVQEKQRKDRERVFRAVQKRRRGPPAVYKTAVISSVNNK